MTLEKWIKTACSILKKEGVTGQRVVAAATASEDRIGGIGFGYCIYTYGHSSYGSIWVEERTPEKALISFREKCREFKNLYQKT